MKKYIITYDFRNSLLDYMPFYKALKVNMPENKHILETAWVVNTDKTASEIVELLQPYLHSAHLSCDLLFVAEINKDNVGGRLAMPFWPFITDKKKENDKEDKEKVG